MLSGLNTQALNKSSLLLRGTLGIWEPLTVIAEPPVVADGQELLALLFPAGCGFKHANGFCRRENAVPQEAKGILLL